MSSPASPSKYKYSPLTSAISIRLLKLLPGEDEPIECEIFEISTEDSIPYTALSYAWGSDVNQKDIACSGGSRLTVRSNLYQALQRIRHPVELRTMWVDAICINQNDVHERNHQVALMTRVYTRAEKLIIWLGDRNNARAHLLIAQLATHPSGAGYSDSSDSLFRLDPKDWTALSRYLDSAWFRRVWVIQELVLGLRLEGPFATQILCGPHVVTWTQLLRCRKWLVDHWATLYTHSTYNSDALSVRYQLREIKRLRRMTTQPPMRHKTDLKWMSWLTVELPRIRSKSCTDPRDKIFALYGLCGLETQPLPDYTLPASVVYREFAREAIIVTRSLNILHEVEVRSTMSTVTVPSWVPDWSVLLERSNLGGMKLLATFVAPQMFDSATELHGVMQSDPDILGLNGIKLDEVLYTSEWIPSIGTPENPEESTQTGVKWRVVPSQYIHSLWRSILGWRLELIESSDSPDDLKLAQKDVFLSNSDTLHPARQALFSNFICTLVTNDEVPGLVELLSQGETHFLRLLSQLAGDPSVPLDHILRSRREIMGTSKKTIQGDHQTYHSEQTSTQSSGESTSKHSAQIANSPTRADDAATMTTYLNFISGWARGRRFFVTKKGRMGLGVRTLAAGDDIAVLSAYGDMGQSPFAIRPSGNRYTLVGEAYLHELGSVDLTDKTWEKIELI